MNQREALLNAVDAAIAQWHRDHPGVDEAYMTPEQEASLAEAIAAVPGVVSEEWKAAVAAMSPEELAAMDARWEPTPNEAPQDDQLPLHW